MQICFPSLFQNFSQTPTLDTKGFFSPESGSFVSSAAGRLVFGRGWKTQAAKPETAHENPLAPRVTNSSQTQVENFSD